MGLYCSHGAWRGAYGAFDRLRKCVCEAVGGTWPVWTESTGYWTWDPDTVPRMYHAGIKAFLSHSDCDGELSPQECLDVAEALEWVAYRLEDSGAGHLADGGPRAGARRFAEGCRRAGARGEPLTFG